MAEMAQLHPRIALLVIVSWLIQVSRAQQPLDVWRTTGDESEKLQIGDAIPGVDTSRGGLSIDVDRLMAFQSIKGFGAAFSNAAASLIYGSPSKDVILDTLFHPVTGIGLSYVRLVMGGSDFNAVEPYTYDDTLGNEDFDLLEFSIDKDRDFVIPLLQEVKLKYPDVAIMASPWSAPAWMKTSESLFGGKMKQGPNYESTLAEYFVKFIQAYQAEGIAIDAVTIQNEPEHENGGYPTMKMSWQVQRDVIKNYLGPRFQAEGIDAEIIILDHNWDLTWYALNIYNDATARSFISGSAWHCYAGNPGDPAAVKDQYPDKDLYFTECSGGEWDTNFASSLGWNIQNLLIGQTRIGARSVLLWNMALDEFHGPRVGVTGGCSDCRGVITIKASGDFDLNVEYYALGQFSKFARPGAQMVQSSTIPSQSLESVAFRNPDGTVVVVVLNTSWNDQKSFEVALGGKYYYYDNLPTRSVVTFVERV